ncbi:adenosine deaminase [Kocuria sediminis]|uniref:adenosine deaminase n=1 Tax=Kocuria sediminis TaxID=1038857 RepID=A0A6N8GHW2_9MICC|nr:adenosine deaminase [Kocuria sediminis]MUN62508.1 adenosine deaminase [Kocuria sediminis]
MLTSAERGPARVPDRVLRDLPKVCLHDHLDGALRPATVVELAAAAGHRLPVEEPEALGRWIRASADSGSLVRYLETFEHTVAVMQSPEALVRCAREYVEDLVADGVVHAEVRWAPEQHTAGGLSMAEAVEAVRLGLSEGVLAAEDAGHIVSVTQILCAMRHAERSLEVARLVVDNRDRGVVAFDLAGPEDGFPPVRHRAALELLADELMPVTLHAGEAAGIGSIRDALATGRALRLGHGVRIAEDIEIEEEDGVAVVTLGRTAEWVRDRGIALEVCPTSNLQTGAVAAFGAAPERHPVDMLYRTGFTVTISPDNRLMSGTSVTGELAALVAHFGYGLEDLEQLQRNAAAAAFLPLEDRSALEGIITEGFEGMHG